ncbi:hypothetical protein J2J97_31900 (plasmid) [Rhizobium bangladeshense]|uniref:hypothetical protein n=1 Tax=Rhizobium bangladeshense TaxID=1138189 RepID=UPI001A99A926|nr:hypothetical protein [Rhizobium bangladeshense]QSY98676.1 hypothetical protein J2J97_31900 [Rhizobium bangladeshense]
MTAFSSQERCAVRNVLEREWRIYLSTDERDFLRYLIDNTVEWGRHVLDVTLNQMLAGIRSDNDSGWTWRLPPVGFSRRTLERVIAKLKARGAITIDVVHRTCQRISLNFLWSPVEHVMSLLPISKKRKDVAAEDEDELSTAVSLTANLAGKSENVGSLTANLAGIDRQFGGPIKQNDKHNDQNDLSLSPDGSAKSSLPVPYRIRERQRPATAPEGKEPSPVPAAPSRASRAIDVYEDKTEAAIARVQREGVQTRMQKVAAAKERDKAEAYHATYAAAWAETYQGIPCPTWSQRDMQIAKSVLKSRIHDDIAARHDFLDFVVRNWAQIMATKFGWMTKDPPPVRPTMAFMTKAKLMPHFLDAFAERRHYENVKLLPPEERELARLIAGGMQRDEALVALGKRRALSVQAEQQRETKRFNGEAIRRAEEARAKAVAEQKALLRQRAEAAATKTEETEEDGFPELGDYSLEPIDLPEIDYSKWN